MSLASTCAFAGPTPGVFLNGSRIVDPRGLRLVNVDVEIGRDGTVRIVSHPTANSETAPRSGSGPTDPAGSKSRPVEAGPRETVLEPVPSRPPEVETASKVPPEGRYWLAIHDESPIPSELAVEVRLNGQSVGTFNAGETRVIEVTGFLRNGDNLAVVTFRRKNSDGKPVAQNPGAFQVVLAPGKVLIDQDQISLTHPIFSSRREGNQEPGSPEELHFVLPPPERP